jgi:hypothetical protein
MAVGRVQPAGGHPKDGGRNAPHPGLYLVAGSLGPIPALNAARRQSAARIIFTLLLQQGLASALR